VRLFRRRREPRHAVPAVSTSQRRGGWRAVLFGRQRAGNLGAEEQRAVTSVPWNVGPPLYSRAVTPEQALSLVPVFSAVRLLSSQIASLPLQTYRKVGDTRVKIPSGSLFTAPAARGTLYDWLHRCVTSLALRGNAYGLVTRRDSFGYPTMIEWLHPDHVTVQDTALSGPGSYVEPIWYWLGRVLPTEDLVHIAWFTIPGKVQGLSPIEACAATISTGVSAQVYTSDWFNNGAVPPGKFKNSQKKVPQAESDEIKARLVAAIRSRQPLVYGMDWEYDPIAVGANEARFIETMQLNAT
jgi:HK97 family phage portal protein